MDVWFCWFTQSLAVLPYKPSNHQHIIHPSSYSSLLHKGINSTLITQIFNHLFLSIIGCISQNIHSILPTKISNFINLTQSTASMLAPLLLKYLTISKWPLWAASSMGVLLPYQFKIAPFSQFIKLLSSDIPFQLPPPPPTSSLPPNHLFYKHDTPNSH